MQSDDETFWMLALPVWDEWVRQDEQCQSGWDSFDEGQYRDAYDLAVELLRADDEFLPALHLACWSLLGMDKPREAVPVADRIVSLEPADWRSHIVRAWALVGSKQRPAAADSATFALELEPENAAVAVAAGQVFVFASRAGPKAEQASIRALELDPNSAGGFEIRGDLYLYRGNWSSAIEAYQQALLKSPDAERLLGKLAAAQLAWFSRHDAYLTYRRLLERYPSTRWLSGPGGDAGIGCGAAYSLTFCALLVVIWAAALEPVRLVGSCLIVVLLYTVIAPARRWIYKRIAPKSMAKAAVAASRRQRNPDVVAGIVASAALFGLFLISLS